MTTIASTSGLRARTHAVAATPPPQRLAFLDGVRGLAALYVCMHHAYCELIVHGTGARLPAWIRRPGRVWLFGHDAVDLFIVLSGFCLMLPSVSTGRLCGGLPSYAYRRARRILPPYYASLLVPLVLMALVPSLRQPTGFRWDVLLPATTWDVLASHAFLFHNVSIYWCCKMTGTAWSVATEAQIYVLFPLLLLCWRQLGDAFTIGLGLAVGILATAAFSDVRLSGWCPWYVGLFAMGMMAASVPLGEGRWRGPAMAAALALAGVALAMASRRAPEHGALGPVFRRAQAGYAWHLDASRGLTCAAFFIACRWLDARPRTLLNPLRWLESPVCMRLGVFSYSLYLIHYPLVSAGHLAVHRAGLSPAFELALMLAVVVPITILLSYLFYLAVERPFAPTAYAIPRSRGRAGARGHGRGE
jgi:peptidoglycan/LPS O-acetylase OafA/YrhL